MLMNSMPSECSHTVQIYFSRRILAVFNHKSVTFDSGLLLMCSEPDHSDKSRSILPYTYDVNGTTIAHPYGMQLLLRVLDMRKAFKGTHLYCEHPPNPVGRGPVWCSSGVECAERLSPVSTFLPNLLLTDGMKISLNQRSKHRPWNPSLVVQSYMAPLGMWHTMNIGSARKLVTNSLLRWFDIATSPIITLSYHACRT